MLKQIDYKTACSFICPKHYSGRVPNISFAYGWFEDNKLVGAITFGIPASYTLCEGICGKEFKDKVLELNRLCRVDKMRASLSEFVGAVLREIKNKNLIIVSFSDMAMNHHGYIYQATNFIYTGETKPHIDKISTPQGHERSFNNSTVYYKRVRSVKHRYIYFACDKRHKKEYIKNFKLKQLPYPKGDNSNYVLGEFMNPDIIGKFVDKSKDRHKKLFG